MKKIWLLYLSVMALFLAGCQLSASTPTTMAPLEEVEPSDTPTTTVINTPSTEATNTPTVPPSATSTATATSPPPAEPTDTFTPGAAAGLPEAQGQFQAVTYTSSVLPGTITGLYASEDGGMWLVSDQGFARLDDGRWEVHLSELANQLVWVDETGRIWAVNEEANEISRWEGDAWTTYGKRQGWEPIWDWFAQVGSRETDSDGNLWLSTSQDVRLFNGEKWHIFTPEDMLMPPPEYEDTATEMVLQVLENGQAWVGSCFWSGPGPFGGAGVRWHDGESWQGTESPVAAGCVTQIEEDSQGNVWVAMEDQLWRYTQESGSWSQYKAPEPAEAQRYGFATEMVVDDEGVVWIILAECGGASCFGATVPYRVEDGDWEQFAERDDSGMPRLLLASDGDVWIFWAGGVSRIEAGEPALVTELFATHQTVDTGGNLWIVSGSEDEQVLWWVVDDG